MKKDRQLQKRPLRVHAETVRLLDRNQLGVIIAAIGSDFCASYPMASTCCQQ